MMKQHLARLVQRMHGQSLVEVLVAIALSAIMLPALATAVASAREGRAQSSERLKAAALLREAEEAVRSIREGGWGNVATNGTYHPIISGPVWVLASGSQSVDGFTRQVVVSSVQRNGAGAIVSGGGTVDASTKKITITVSWDTPIAATLSSEAYLQRYQNNVAWQQTTQADFTAGSKTNTSVVDAAGGEVQLSTLPGGVDWTTPTMVGTYDAGGTQDNFDVFVVGNYAYLADSTVLRILDISNPTVPNQVGLYTSPGTINQLYVSGNYAYLANGGNSSELVVVNISNPASPILAANLNLSGTVDAQSVFVEGNYAYLGRLLTSGTTAPELYIIDISNPAAPSLKGSLDVTANVNDVHVSGSVAYLATAVDSQELKTVNIATKTAPVALGSFDMPGAADATDLDVVGNIVYLARVWDAANPELYVIGVSNPAVPTSIGSYEINGVGSINGVTVSGDYAFLATDASGRQFIVLDVTTPSAPTVKSTKDLFATAFNVRINGNDVYLATGHDTQEMMILRGSTGAGGYQASGNFESSTFDAGAPNTPAYNFIAFTATTPLSTTLRIQVASNNDNATWNYVGPDGTAGTFYDVSQAIRFGTNGRYFRYKATLTGSGTNTPILSDVSVNFAP